MTNPHQLPKNLSFGTRNKEHAQAFAAHLGFECKPYEWSEYGNRAIRWGITKGRGGFLLIRDFELPLASGLFTGKACGRDVMAGVME